MTNKEMLPILAALRSKPTQANLTPAEFNELYLYVLRAVPSEHASALLRWVVLDSNKWRPTTDQIHAYCEKLAGALCPDGPSVIREIRAAIARFGKYGRPVPGRQLHLLGTPEMSFEALRFVDRRGGWSALLDSRIGNEDLFWREAEEEAAAVCEAVKIERLRAAIAVSIAAGPTRHLVGASRK